jgi:hypothetical protein
MTNTCLCGARCFSDPFNFPQMLERTEDQDPYSSHDEIVDESWDSMTRSLEKQMNLVNMSQGGAATTN